MVSVLPLPDWVPLWVHAVILCAAGLLAVSFLLLPFAVFGTKGRLEAIDARLDEIQGEIRSLSLRLPEPLADPHDEDEAYAANRYRDDRQADSRYADRPPIPPAPRDAVIPERLRSGALPPAARPPSVRPNRTEPRLY